MVRGVDVDQYNLFEDLTRSDQYRSLSAPETPKTLKRNPKPVLRTEVILTSARITQAITDLEDLWEKGNDDSSGVPIDFMTIDIDGRSYSHKELVELRKKRNK